MTRVFQTFGQRGQHGVTKRHKGFTTGLLSAVMGVFLLWSPPHAHAVDYYIQASHSAALFEQGAAVYNATPAQAFLQDFTSRGLAVLHSTSLSDQKKRERIQNLVEQGFDVTTIARTILGRYWTKLSAEDQKRYRDLYFQYMVNTYLQYMIEVRDPSLKISGSKGYGNKDVLVTSHIENEKTDGPFQVKWRLRNGQKGYRIIDLILKGGYSLTLTQRDEFSAILGKSGFETLMARMEEKVAASSASYAAQQKTWQ